MLKLNDESVLDELLDFLAENQLNSATKSLELTNKFQIDLFLYGVTLCLSVVLGLLQVYKVLLEFLIGFRELLALSVEIHRKVCQFLL